MKVFSGATGALISSFLPFAPAFTGGVSVAAGDVNGDGKADVVVGAASGGSQVKIFNSTTGTCSSSFLGSPRRSRAAASASG